MVARAGLVKHESEVDLVQVDDKVALTERDGGCRGVGETRLWNLDACVELNRDVLVDGNLLLDTETIWGASVGCDAAKGLDAKREQGPARVRVKCSAHVEARAVIHVEVLGKGDLVGLELQATADETVLPGPLERNVARADVQVGAQRETRETERVEALAQLELDAWVCVPYNGLCTQSKTAVPT